MSVKQTSNPKVTPAAGVIYGFDPSDSNKTNALKINPNGSLYGLEGLSIPGHDYISLGYTGSNVTTVTYKTGGSNGTTVATLTLAYDGSNNLTSITKA